MRFYQIPRSERYMTSAARKALKIMSNARANNREAKDRVISRI